MSGRARAGGAGGAPLPADELIDIVDEHDRVVGQARRGDAYARGLRHRCAFILVRDAAGRIFVHRRTATKLVFPSMYDMFVGGVVGAGESYDAAAARESAEELGVTGLAAPEFRLKCEYRDGRHLWWCAVYEARCDAPVRPQVEEIDWYALLTDAEVERRLPEWAWVPDSLRAYDELRAWYRRRGPAR